LANPGWFPVGAAASAGSANQRTVDANSTGFHTDDASDTIVYAVDANYSASRGYGISSVIIDDPRPHAAGEAGHRGRADRR